VTINFPANIQSSGDMAVYLSGNQNISGGAFKVKSSLLDAPVIGTDVSA